MAMRAGVRFRVDFEDVFPAGAYVTSGVEAVRDFDAKSARDDQKRDRSGTRLWQVRVIDADPEARTSEVKVKIAAEHQPVPPDAMVGAPFRPVEFTGLWVVPYIDERGSRARLAFSLYAEGMRAPGTVKPVRPVASAGAA